VCAVSVRAGFSRGRCSRTSLPACPRQPWGIASAPPAARRFLSTTTATSYSLVGSLNKIPVAVIGLVAFNVPWNAENLASILVGLFAGIIFVKAKQMPPAK
jgi:hypothetical protein